MSPKSWLLRHPNLYEPVQALRDCRFFAEGLVRGHFAQHGEDRLLLERLRQANARGPYVDVGANHPFRLSNTYLLYRHGWRGLCVDPLPRLARLHARWRPDDRFACALVGEGNAPLPFFEFESDVLSTPDETTAQAYLAAGHRLLRREERQAQRLDTLIEQAGLAAPLALLSIDVEGFELPVLRSLTLERWRPAFVCLEVVNAVGAQDSAAASWLRERAYADDGTAGSNLLLRRRA